MHKVKLKILLFSNQSIPQQQLLINSLCSFRYFSVYKTFFSGPSLYCRAATILLFGGIVFILNSKLVRNLQEQYKNFSSLRFSNYQHFMTFIIFFMIFSLCVYIHIIFSKPSESKLHSCSLSPKYFSVYLLRIFSFITIVQVSKSAS